MTGVTAPRERPLRYSPVAMGADLTSPSRTRRHCLLRPWTAVVSILTLAAVPAGAAGFCPTPTEDEVLTLINQERQARGLVPLQMDARLVQAARLHSEDMASNNFFSHTGSNGSSFVQRIQATGFPFGGGGETIGAGYTSAAAVVQGWMNSDGHRAILLGGYLHVGVGYAFELNSAWRHYWTADFANTYDGGQPPGSGCSGPPDFENNLVVYRNGTWSFTQHP